VSRLQRFALLAPFILLSAWIPAATEAIPSTTIGAAGNTQVSDERLSGSLDLVLLLDKSLSMAPFFDEVKSYAAGEVLGPILVPGDRLIVELVFGKVQRLYSGSIGSERDKATAIRSLREVEADGAFTDLGLALDAAARDIEELGEAERPKYVLLITDERQEAPAGSPYQSPDYRLRHPFLEYVKRVDLGRFRAVTIGLQVKAKVESARMSVLSMLSEPPESRGSASFASSETAAAEADIHRVGPSGGADGPSSADAAVSSQPEAAHARGGQDGGTSRTLAIVGAAIGSLALAAALVVPLVLRSRRKDEKQKGES